MKKWLLCSYVARVVMLAVVLAGAVNLLLPTSRASAHHPDNPAIPNSPYDIEHTALSHCPASNTAPGQTIHVIYFNPSTITSGGGGGSTSMFGTSVMCTNSNYNQVRDINIFLVRVSRTAGTGNVSFTSNNIHPPNIPPGHFERFSGPASTTANFSNLSLGWNCWDIEYDASARYGSSVSNITGTGISNLCVYYNPPQPATHWNYVHQSFSTSPASATSTPYPRHRPGTAMNVSNRIRNNNNGTGRSYQHQIQVRVGSGAWSNIGQWNDGGLASGASRTRNASYNLPTNGVANDTTVCFRGRIQPFSGQSTPSSTTTSSGWRTTSVRCVRVYNPPPTTGSISSGCSFYRVTINDAQDGYTLQLFADGVSAGPSYRTSFGRGTNSHEFDLSAWDGFGTHAFYVRVTDNGPLGSSVNSMVRNVGPCITSDDLSCGNLTTSIASPETGQAFGVQVSINYSIGSRGEQPSRPTYRMSVSIPGAPYSNPDTPYTTNATTAIATTGDLTLPPGHYAATWSFSGGGVSVGPCSGEFRVVKKSYFRVYNSDALAGFRACAGWTGTPSAGTIIAFNDGNGRGSGVQLAAFALGAIDGFSSATGRAANPRPATGLTFANTSLTPYGGDFGDGACPPDYFSLRPSSTTSISGVVNVSSLASGSYAASGDITLSGNYGDGRKITIYAEGDVYIDGAGITNDGNWASLDEIPNFTLVARGNIYISPSVNQLDGNYIAQPGGSDGGQIFTCGFAYRSPNATELNSQCDRRLVVNGSFTARRIRLLRTNGTLRQSSNGEARSSSTIAEVMVFSPEMWLSPPVDRGSGAAPYDAITSLPPVL